MKRRRIVLCAAFMVLAVLMAWPTDARAQSVIAGLVKDTQGGVLPGVTVEVASDALIEGTKSTTTDGAGQYRIIDLRPGVYTVTFSLVGFKTVRRDKFELQSEFTATINADLQIGALSETITVTGAAPLVNLESAAKVQVMDRGAIDNIPTSRTIQGLGQLIIGVQLSAPDVGGAHASQQTYFSVHGQGAAQSTIMVDGMTANSMEGNGAVQAYYTDGMVEQISYQTSGIGADRSGGGVTVNLVPREGGNRFSTLTTANYRPGDWQSSNVTPRIKTLGLLAGSSTLFISEANLSEGGPIKKNRLWFFTTISDFETDNRVADVFFDDGRQGDDPAHIRHALVRLTYQLSARNKVSFYFDRTNKYRGFVAGALADRETAGNVWTFSRYQNGQATYKAPVTNKIFVDGGYSFNTSWRDEKPQPGTEFERGTPEWYSHASRTTQVTGPRSTAAATNATQYKTKQNLQASVSYVTGTHHVKAGVGWQWGWFSHGISANGDITQRYSSFTQDPATHNYTFVGPVDVLVRNTPLFSRERLNRDLSMYAQDSFTMKRLTVNYGVRREYLNSQVDQTSSDAGRFVPARTQLVYPNVPNWKDWAPRFQLVLDLFGTGRTAIKYSLNRYNRAETSSTAASFNTLSSTTSARQWTDLNTDDIAQGARIFNADRTFTDCVYLTPGCEINLSGSATQGGLAANFGLPSDAGIYGGFPRLWNLEHGLEVQHALMSRLAVSGSWFHWNDHNLTKTVNTALTDADYTPITVYNPIDGTPITYYNISSAASSRASNNVTIVEPLRKNSFDGYTIELQARPYGGAQVFGGLGLQRTSAIDCATSIAGASVSPNSLRFCDETQNGKRFSKDFRISASFPLAWGLNVGGVYLNNDGGSINPTYTFSRTIRYPDGTSAYTLAGTLPLSACPTTYGCVPGALTAPTLTSASASVALSPGATVSDERLQQVDLRVSRNFKVGKVSIAPAFEAFNIFNTDLIIGRVSASYANAAGTYLRPSELLQGRMLGLGVNMKW